jgi:hypothetical protein
MSARWLAWALGALTLELIACALVLALLNRYSLWDVTFLVAQVSAALVCGPIASRRPRNPVGWFIIGHALCFTLGGVLAAVRDLRPPDGTRLAARSKNNGLATVLDLVPRPHPDVLLFATLLYKWTPRLTLLASRRLAHRLPHRDSDHRLYVPSWQR